MEISLLGPETIKLKGKQVACIVDPAMGRVKYQADFTILLSQTTEDVPVEGSRVAIYGAGEYEIGGVKITGVQKEDQAVYYLTLDGVSLLIAKASSLKGKEGQEVDMMVLLADETVESSVLASLNPSVVVVYGPKGKDEVAALGKTAQEMAKYAITRDKLPQEMEVVVLE